MKWIDGSTLQRKIYQLTSQRKTPPSRGQGSEKMQRIAWKRRSGCQEKVKSAVFLRMRKGRPVVRSKNNQHDAETRAPPTQERLATHSFVYHYRSVTCILSAALGPLTLSLLFLFCSPIVSHLTLVQPQLADVRLKEEHVRALRQTDQKQHGAKGVSMVVPGHPTT